MTILEKNLRVKKCETGPLNPLMIIYNEQIHDFVHKHYREA